MSMRRTVSYEEGLSLAHRVTAPAIRQAIRKLGFPKQSRGLDVGCGVGRHILWLAEAIESPSHIVGLDIATDRLVSARRLTRSSPSCIDFITGDIHSTPFADRSFDWIWCADTLWPGPEIDAPTDVVKELARIVRSGGQLALVYWSNQSLLPGYPTLEARLNRVFVETTPYLAGPTPERQFMRALGWLEAAGIKRPEAQSFVAELQGPLSASQQEAVEFCCDMFWGSLEKHVSREDWTLYERLSRRSSDAGLFKQPDYYGNIVYTCFHGLIP
jgi:demethylmenaquinone methyltransferase/2-methoxy-6-polyprenyl-1,4-benzoquinol methylase